MQADFVLTFQIHEIYCTFSISMVLLLSNARLSKSFRITVSFTIDILSVIFSLSIFSCSSASCMDSF